jgi:hypothetical protein
MRAIINRFGIQDSALEAEGAPSEQIVFLGKHSILILTHTCRPLFLKMNYCRV